MSNITETLANFCAPERVRLENKLDREYMSHKTDNHEIYGMDYDRYLKTAFWKKIKTWIKTRDDYKCQLCGSKRRYNLEVHHRDYERETLEGYRDTGLITLCSFCHHKVEFYDKNQLNKRNSIELKEKYLKQCLDDYNEWQTNNKHREAELSHIIVNTEIELHRYEKSQHVPDFVITARLADDIKNEINLGLWAVSLFRRICTSEFVQTQKSHNEQLDKLNSGGALKITRRATKKSLFSISLPKKNQLKIRATKHCDIDLRDVLDTFIDEQGKLPLKHFDNLLVNNVLTQYKPEYEDVH